MKIGIIGPGQIGSTVGTLWVKADHDVLFGSRHPDKRAALTTGDGRRAPVATTAAAAGFADVVFVAIPFGGWPELAHQLGARLAGKVVIDASNPVRARDGAVAEMVQELGRGSGAFVAELLPASRVVKAFNTLAASTLAREAGRAGERLAVPVAGNDAEAVATTAGLVRDAGFDPVTLEGIDRASAFEMGTAAFNSPMSAATLRRALESVI
jgi:predicted dinucleotide-binding enzyme